MIIYLAALQGVPQDVQEAATIDGASALQRFRFITLPLISGSFTICFTLSLINGLKVFDQIAVMTDGGPGFATETIVYLLYKSGFGEGRQGYGTAVGVVLLFIILILNNIQSAILSQTGGAAVMATQTVQATNTTPKKKIKIAPIVCFIVTVILGVLFIYPVYFAVISAFKSNGEILKAPLAFPTELYLQNFKDLFAKTDFFHRHLAHGIF